MSKDMLGSLVRASSTLPRHRITVALDLVNRLAGKGGAEWTEHFKKIIREGLPDRDNVPEREHYKSPNWRKLRGKHAGIKFEKPSLFSASLLRTGNCLNVSQAFERDIVWKARRIEDFTPRSVRSFELLEEMRDFQIRLELGDESTFDEFELCYYLWVLTQEQGQGTRGVLSAVSVNVLYAGDNCVVARYNGDEKFLHWSISALPPDLDPWPVGTRILCPE